MAFKVKTEDRSIKISAKWGEVDLKIELPHLGLYFLTYLVLLSLLFFSLTLSFFQAYWFIPLSFLAILFLVAFYWGLDYRYLIVSGLLFLAGSFGFFVSGGETPAQRLANYAFWFFVLGLLFVPVTPLVKKIRDREYLPLFRRSYAYFFVLLVMTVPFLVVNNLYWAEVNRVLGSPEPRVEAEGLLSSGLIYLLRSNDEEARKALDKSFEAVLLKEVPSRFLGGKELTYGAAYNDLGETPQWMEPDTQYTVLMEIINIGSATWEVKGKNPVHFSYKWSDLERGKTIVPDGLRTPLPEKVAPGEKVIIEAMVRSPSKEGTFMLSYQLVKEGEFWFKEAGSTPLRRMVTVSSLEETEELPDDLLRNYNIGFIGNQANQVPMEMQIDQEGSYRLLVGERWEETLGTLRVKVDQGEWQSVASATTSAQLMGGLADLGKIYLDKGSHTIFLRNSVPSYNFDCVGAGAVLLLKEFGTGTRAGSGAGSSEADVEKERQQGSPEVQYGEPSLNLERINRIKYLAHVESQSPFFLRLSSPYNPNWILASKEQTIPLHYEGGKGENLWFIEEAGKYDLVLQYRGVDLLTFLRLASLAAIPIYVLLIPLDLYRLRKNKKYFPHSS